METNNRRDFLKKAALAGASALVAPSLFAADGEGRGEFLIRTGVRKNGIWIFSI